VGGLLVTAWDGTTLKAPATPENTAAPGRPRHGGERKAPKGGKDPTAPPGEGHYPQMRVVALIACGTRALPGAAIGPLTDGEQKIAATLTGCPQPGMPLLAGRGFWSLALWQACTRDPRPPAVARHLQCNDHIVGRRTGREPNRVIQQELI
jgi:hypothetical protein